MSDKQRRFATYFATYMAWVLWLAWVTNILDGFSDWVNAWHRWDAEWYFRIWNLGYLDDPRTLAFPPGFSWITGYLSSFTHMPFDLSAMLIGLVSYFTAGVIACEVLAKRLALSAEGIWLFWLASPVAFYAFVPYSDALFAMFFWFAFMLALREPKTLSRRAKIVAALTVFVAPWIRLTGFALAIWLPFRRWFAFSVLFALGFWLLFNWLAIGDMWHFVHAQKAYLMPEGWFIDGLRYHLHDLMHPPGALLGADLMFWAQGTVLPLLSMTLLLISVAWLMRKGEWLAAVTVLAVTLFSRNQSYWRSVLRYDLPLVPWLAVPWLAWSSKQNKLPVRYLARVGMALLLLIGFFLQWGVARRFHYGGWAY